MGIHGMGRHDAGAAVVTAVEPPPGTDTGTDTSTGAIVPRLLFFPAGATEPAPMNPAAAGRESAPTPLHPHRGLRQRLSELQLADFLADFPDAPPEAAWHAAWAACDAANEANQALVDQWRRRYDARAAEVQRLQRRLAELLTGGPPEAVGA